MKFEGYRHATYQQIIVYPGDLSTRMDFDTMRRLGGKHGARVPGYAVWSTGSRGKYEFSSVK